MEPEFIVGLRHRLGWTQKQLAERLKISVRKVQLLESGASAVSHIDAIAIAEIDRTHPRRSERRNLKMALDFHGLIRILAGHLYSRREIFIRELVQNSHDAIWRRAYADTNFEFSQGRIDIATDLASSSGRLVIRDNGIGMTDDDLIDFLSSIGRSGTEESEKDVPEVIGQFGIGFLSGFVVARRIEVRTRHFTATPDQACLWISDGDQDYTLAPTRMEQVGTEIIIYIKDAADRGLLQEERLRGIITKYADMLRVPIHLNDPQHARAPVNMRAMPWESEGVSPDEMRLDNMIYLEKRVPDSVLEVIPVKEPDAEGLLYITRVRVIGRDTPRTMRVYLKRMFLCDGAISLLPEWASFVNGILNTRSLEPNAARDNYLEGKEANDPQDRVHDLRTRLGLAIISHLEELKTSNPIRLSEIMAYHDVGIKAACHYYDPFFKAFGHLLEWRINPGSPLATKNKDSRQNDPESTVAAAWATLPDLVANATGRTKGGLKRLSCFTSRSAASQYFKMADAAGNTVIDASGLFEDELIKEWAKSHEGEVSVVHVDVHDDPDVFRDADPKLDKSVNELAKYMSARIFAGDARLFVQTRRFSPDTVASILRGGEEAASVRKARSILNDPNAPGELKKLAEDNIRMRKRTDVRMFINAENDLVRGLAGLVAEDSQDPDASEVATGLYNSAILANSQSMGEANAAIFSQQYQRLMQRVMEMVRQTRDAKAEREEMARARVMTRPQGGVLRRHLQGFHITSFGPDFDAIRDTLRQVMEVEFQCELISADQRRLKPWINSNVREHIAHADFFVVDLTDLASLNVLIEIGAIGYGRPDAPALFISGVNSPREKPRLPADLEGLIVVPYVKGAPRSDWVRVMVSEFKKDASFDELLKLEGRERFVSARLLSEWTRHVVSDDGALGTLVGVFPTVSSWQHSSLDDVIEVLRAYKLDDLAGVVRARVLSSAETLGR